MVVLLYSDDRLEVGVGWWWCECWCECWCDYDTNSNEKIEIHFLTKEREILKLHILNGDEQWH